MSLKLSMLALVADLIFLCYSFIFLYSLDISVAFSSKLVSDYNKFNNGNIGKEEVGRNTSFVLLLN